MSAGRQAEIHKIQWRAANVERNLGFFFRLTDQGYPQVVKVERGTIAYWKGVEPFWLLKEIDGTDAKSGNERRFLEKMQRMVNLLMLENLAMDMMERDECAITNTI